MWLKDILFGKRAARIPEALAKADKDVQLNVYNFRDLRAAAPDYYAAIRFDPNNTCNLHCVYCHNHRSEETIGDNDLRAFLDNNVLGVQHFQMGCIMEPTLDKRLADMMLTVAQSPAKPRNTFMLQTNGILLHKHDMGKMREAGLTMLSVSVDAAEPGTQKELRNGTSLDKVVRNVRAFREGMPHTKISFITTVTTANVGKMRELVRLGLDVGVDQFVFREVFYHPENDVVDHTRMPGLLLAPGQFSAMAQDLRATFGTTANFYFSDQEMLDTKIEQIKVDSLMSR